MPTMLPRSPDLVIFVPTDEQTDGQNQLLLAYVHGVMMYRSWKLFQALAALVL